MTNRILALFLAALSVLFLFSCASRKTEQEETTEEAEQSLPDFRVYDGEGNKVTLHEKKGKPVVLNFWATWCSPCRAEMPYFDKLYDEYGDEIEFMMVNLTDGQRDTEDSVEAFIDQMGYDFPVYLDSDRSASFAYGVQSIPMTFFIDENGKLFTYHKGMMSEEALRSCIEKMMGE